MVAVAAHTPQRTIANAYEKILEKRILSEEYDLRGEAT